MLSIGNDIVDLQQAEKESNWQRKGFLEKQFTIEEQDFILNSETPFLSVWVFWSMKEAAYKCFTQKNESRFFAPKKFECKINRNGTGLVSFNGLKFYTSTIKNEFYIHTIAQDILVKDINKAYLFSSIGSPNTLDKDLRKSLELQTGITYREIEKRKTMVGAPLFYYKEKRITNSCSISHHGNYGAFAFTLNDRN